MEPANRLFSSARISAGSRQLLVGPGVLLARGADEGAVLDPRHVTGVGAGQVGVGALGLREPLEGPGVDQLLAELVVLLGGSVAPVDVGGFGQLGDAVHPVQQGGIRGRGGRGLAHLLSVVSLLPNEISVTLSAYTGAHHDAAAGAANPRGTPIRRVRDDGQRHPADLRRGGHSCLAGAGLRLLLRAPAGQAREGPDRPAGAGRAQAAAARRRDREDRDPVDRGVRVRSRGH